MFTATLCPLAYGPGYDSATTNHCAVQQSLVVTSVAENCAETEPTESKSLLYAHSMSCFKTTTAPMLCHNANI